MAPTERFAGRDPRGGEEVEGADAARVAMEAVEYSARGTQCLGATTMFGFVEMLVFIGTLVVALAYVWRKRAIGWG